MSNFFIEGGWGMWPVLVLGMVTVGAAVRFARSPGAAQVSFLKAIAAATLAATLLAGGTNVAAVMRFVSDPANVADADVQRTMMVGLNESVNPIILSAALLMIASLITAARLALAARKPEHA